MSGNQYAIHSLDTLNWSNIGRDIEEKDLTKRLGCSYTSVRVYRTQSGTPISLGRWVERLVVPIYGAGTVIVEETHNHVDQSIAVVQAGVPAQLMSDSTTVWIVVSVSAVPTSNVEFTSIDMNDLEYNDPEISHIHTARITDKLDCCGMKVNVGRLGQGEAVPYHFEGSQEEIYIPYDGPGKLRVGDLSIPVEKGTVCRFPSDIQRGVVNPTKQSVRWLMVGTPLAGDDDNRNLGPRIHEWSKSDPDAL